MQGPLLGPLRPQHFLTVVCGKAVAHMLLLAEHMRYWTVQVVDGALGAQWLGAFKKYIEDPLNMLV